MNVSLREVKESDLEHLMKWRTSEEITRYMKTDPELTMEDQKKWLGLVRENEKTKHWMIDVDGVRSGIIYLEDIEWTKGICSWGYYIGEKKSRSFQLAMSLELSLYNYMFSILGFSEVYNEVLSANTGVLKIHEVCGCIVAEEKKKEIVKNGVEYDVTRLSINKSRWNDIEGTRNYTKIDFNTDLHIHHLGYAVSDVEKSVKSFERLGFVRVSEVVEDTLRNVNIVFVKNKLEGTIIELVEPISEKSPVSKSLKYNKNVAHPYHVCYEVENLQRSIEMLKRQGYYLISDSSPALAIRNRDVAFMLQRDGGMVELLQGGFYDEG